MTHGGAREHLLTIFGLWVIGLFWARMAYRLKYQVFNYLSLKAIKQLRDKHAKLEDEGIEKLSAEQVEEIEDEWFNSVLPLGLKDFNKEDLDTMSEGEIRELTASVYIFLTKFGSTALAKQFVTATKEIQPKEKTQ